VQPLEGTGWRAALKGVSATWPLPVVIIALTAVGMLKGIKVYDAVVEGGKEGFQIALRIIPYLVAILVVVGMLRASGALDLMAAALSPLTDLVGMPAETLPMALLRPLTGNGAFAFAAETMKTHGPDSLIGNIVSTMQGSTETTFYVLALYYGVVGVRRTRHTLYPCLAADIAGLLAAVWWVRLLLGDGAT
jgi:spore maturation protein SpmB